MRCVRQADLRDVTYLPLQYKEINCKQNFLSFNMAAVSRLRKSIIIFNPRNEEKMAAVATRSEA